MPANKFVSVLRTLMIDLRASVRLGADVESRLRLAFDFVLSRFIRLIPKGWRNQLREVRLRGDVRIRYRLNKGDLHSVREIWFENDYYLPFTNSPGLLLDLGANIGMASIWLAQKYSFAQVIAVEPDPTNAALVRQNLELNGINGQVLEAAIGPTESMARFEFSEFSNMGRLSEDGTPVKMISVATIIKDFGVSRFALVKIDIEGGEQKLFDSSTEWLATTDAIIIELHPTVVDCPKITKFVSSQGFRYIPAHSLSPDNMDCFTRTG
jgi:FkbM family methyltransferase